MNRAAVTAREAVRHMIYVSGAYGALTWLRERRGDGNSAHLKGEDAKSRFRAIYETGVWRHGDHHTPGSGSGSSLLATSALRESLPALLDSIGARTLLDIGCGDFTWMRHVKMSQNYIGVDVVASVIAQNKKAFEAPARRFVCVDAIVDDLPDADIVMCREVLFHLSLQDIRKLLRNITAKKRAYLMLTSDRRTLFNSDIPTGDFRLLNMEAWPLRFPRPESFIDDSAVSPNRIIGVWNVERLPRSLISDPLRGSS